MSRAEYERIAALQDDYIAEQDMVVVEGYIGSDPAERTGARLYVEAAERQHRRHAAAALLPARRRGRSSPS